jgi:hypothetical protein
VSVSQRSTRQYRTDIMWERLVDGAQFECDFECDVTITGARYGGGYEGGLWLAFVHDTEWLDQHQAGDNECRAFFSDYWNAPIGRGETPNKALTDLHRIVSMGRAAYEAERGGRAPVDSHQDESDAGSLAS